MKLTTSYGDWVKKVYEWDSFDLKRILLREINKKECILHLSDPENEIDVSISSICDNDTYALKGVRLTINKINKKTQQDVVVDLEKEGEQ